MSDKFTDAKRQVTQARENLKQTQKSIESLGFKKNQLSAALPKLNDRVVSAERKRQKAIVDFCRSEATQVVVDEAKAVFAEAKEDKSSSVEILQIVDRELEEEMKNIAVRNESILTAERYLWEIIYLNLREEIRSKLKGVDFLFTQAFAAHSAQGQYRMQYKEFITCLLDSSESETETNAARVELKRKHFN